MSSLEPAGGLLRNVERLKQINYRRTHTLVKNLLPGAYPSMTAQHALQTRYTTC